MGMEDMELEDMEGMEAIIAMLAWKLMSDIWERVPQE